jgi:hypothetical protein
VLLVRCASHSRYHGYPRLLGVASWRGLRVQFAGGICPTCATRVTGKSTPPVPPSRTTRWPGGDRAAALFVGLPLTAALVLAASPVSEPPPAVSALASSVATPGATSTAADAPAPPAGTLERNADGVVRPAIAAPRIARAAAGGTRALGVRIVPARHPLSSSSIVVIARDVERIAIQAP